MLTNIRQLDYVVLICDDPERMRAFYSNLFGFQLHRDLVEHRWTELRAGSLLLALRPRWQDEGTCQPGSTAVQLAFRVAPSQVDACFEELKQQGVEIVDGPRDQSWGHRTLFFRDPEHNLLEIYADL
jgi:lactoylglutathione lyase